MNAQIKKIGDANFSWHIMLLIILSVFSTSIFSQADDARLTATILYKDSLFWSAYNNCNVKTFTDFFTDDIEFYHDKGGITLGAVSLDESLKKNICGSPDHKVRREAVPGTIVVYPMKKEDSLYGAVITGEHLFYISDNGKPEVLTGHGRFMNLWILKNGEWKMSRILSYDHQPVAYINKRKEIILSENELKQFTGNYKSANFGDMSVVIENKNLILQTSNANFALYPETKNIFFSKERDLTFEFVKKENKIEKMIVRENGNIVEEVAFINK
jgi:hypothetical protein